MLVPAGEEMAEALRSERNQGRSPDMSEIDHDRIGFNYRLTDVQAAIGIAQVERLDELLAARAEVAAGYARAARRQSAAPRRGGRPRRPGAALRRPRRRAAQLVRLRGAAARRRPTATP